MKNLTVRHNPEIQKIDSTISVSNKLIAEINNNNASRYYDEGLMFYKNNKFKDAEQSFLKAIDLKKDFVNAYIELIALMIELKDLKKALIYSNNSLEINIDEPNLLLVRAKVKVFREEYIEAINDFTKAIEKQDEISIAYSDLIIEAYKERGEVKIKLGDFEGARRDLLISEIQKLKTK
jgi:tetratricopeptide (TPR) repeat protein